MTGPLQGVRVLETASFITGPYAGQLLADLGADVVKIEDPHGGDPFRSWGESLYSPHFIAHNRSKRSVTLDLKQAESLAAFDRLADTADVLIENFRPGVADRLGIGYERIKAFNPRIIYCSISGMGQTGPYSKRPSYDTVGQGLSGLLSLLLDPAHPRPVGPAFSDSLTGLFAAYAILGALHARSRTGEGQRVDMSMLEATLSFLVEPFTRYFCTGEVPDSFTRPKQAQVYAFTCADGRAVAIHLSSPQKFWRGLATCTGREEMIDDPRFSTREARIANYELIHQAFEPVFLQKPRDEWLGILEAADVPFTPIYTLDQVLEDPQVRHLDMVQTAEHPAEGEVRLLGFPARFSKTPLDPSRAPPQLGEHTESILKEAHAAAEESAT